MAKHNITESQLRDAVFQAVREQIAEDRKKAAVRRHIRGIVSETVKRLDNEVKQRLNEEDEIGMKRKAVMNMLKDGKYNHAELARKLWHPKDKSEEDTYRSLFSKKATGTPDSDGAVRNFDDGEITKLYELLRTR